MNMWWFIAAIVGGYLAIGFVFFFALLQTPYQEVAHWAIILWPLWLLPH